VLDGSEATPEECEGIAQAALDESGLGDRPNVDTRVLAVAWGRLRLRPAHGVRPHLDGDVIVYPANAPELAQVYYVGHELGHAMVRWAGLRLGRDAEERAASYIACAVILPRRPLLRDMRAEIDLATARPLATPRILRRRIEEVRLLTLNIAA
jgi:Zn-dependent peptidase ImmA (M78 family)